MIEEKEPKYWIMLGVTARRWSPSHKKLTSREWRGRQTEKDMFGERTGKASWVLEAAQKERSRDT
eukprot:CAMPEP_0206608500 /NCGR_PEP_ID=MMETSP0325_2-20121206/53067_1 /ASSEMBLY_ACC=CAM_ASM_000347 /TAXON_ID=2866 /ORGANISM="Crypthecodinium cohnii, Strain Seligo" /LENGTH=64 /DNA_ID=CAMNT_0054126285 /DNA_START=105 /DNA_END=295 /DNA_ORIENTATION=-